MTNADTYYVVASESTREHADWMGRIADVFSTREGIDALAADPAPAVWADPPGASPPHRLFLNEPALEAVQRGGVTVDPDAEMTAEELPAGRSRIVGMQGGEAE